MKSLRYAAVPLRAGSPVAFTFCIVNIIVLAVYDFDLVECFVMTVDHTSSFFFGSTVLWQRITHHMRAIFLCSSLERIR